jgi:hypothetical protein
MPALQFIRQNAELAASFEPMPKPEMQKLSGRIAAANKAALDYHFNYEHRDA